MKRFVGALMLVLALSAAQSEAATIGSLPSNNDVIAGTEGYFGANLYLIAGPGGALIDIEFVGFEAGYTNEFFLNGTSYITNQTTPLGYVATVNVLPGLINFHFTVNSGAATVTNAGNVLPNGFTPNWFVSLAPGPLDSQRDTNVNGVTPGFGQTAWIALDDAGAGPDDNHDDLVLKLTISGGTFVAPDGGATLTLLGCALMGLGALRRRL
jgi:hypothetical protein